jgi:acetone carboxylase gamma subunit
MALVAPEHVGEVRVVSPNFFLTTMARLPEKPRVFVINDIDVRVNRKLCDFCGWDLKITSWWNIDVFKTQQKRDEMLQMYFDGTLGMMVDDIYLCKQCNHLRKYPTSFVSAGWIHGWWTGRDLDGTYHP